MFRAAHATDPDWARAAALCIERLGPMDGDETLGLVYVTDQFADHLEEIETALRDATGVGDWAGAVGLGVCAGGREYFDEPAMAVMTAALPAASFAVLPAIDAAAAAAFGTPKETAGMTGPSFAIIHADTNNPGVVDQLGDLARAASGFLVGGLTASHRPDHHIANGVTGGGISGVLFKPDIAVATALAQGYAPLAPAHEVTSAAGNVVEILDGRRAFDVFMEDVGVESADELRGLAGVVHAAIPVAGSDTGDYMVRNLVGVDPEQGLVGIGDRIDAGARLMFVRRDAEAAVEDLSNMVARLAKRADGKARGALYISCIARGPNMFGALNEEMKLVGAGLGDVPLVGFYANGEISNDRLYSYTGVLTLFL